MGMQAEFNWYIVLKDHNIVDLEDFKQDNVSIDKKYRIVKDEHRIYPMMSALPMIYNGRCIAIAIIHELKWKDSETHLTVEPVLVLNNNDPVRKYYEDSYNSYKQEQQQINDGGKVAITDLVSPQSRTRL